MAEEETELFDTDEEQKYRELYEDLQKELDDQRKQAIETKKETLLTNAGYNEMQVQRYKKHLSGESDGEIQKALIDLKAEIPPKKEYADPNPGNGARQTPKTTNLEEKGRSTYQRLKEKGKIRGKK
ncbi:hypothetical protein F3157_05370 [Virgibacillus dakarensis]|uniref:hypothetical protein n=1 Tax=Virgibacillus dakarensis TaxID=1917889 RepID=UPI000B44AB73|nr:hypothetical protein [Virgibacillus dakarensis]MTW85087.1 hypothetical protein [Virgibacillus dakarensis]